MEDSIIPGTKIGGLKAREANHKRDPDHYRRIGKIGGQNSSGKTNGGFNHATPEQRAEWGRIGGKKSRRKKVVAD